jgi:membrane-associated phospholipid phosphatase
MSLWREKVLVSLAIQSVIAGVFFWIETVNGSATFRAPSWLSTPPDRSLPLFPASVWLYVSWYAIPALLLPLARGNFRRASAAVLVGFLICALGYACFPVTMDRPSVDASAGLSATVLSAVYAIDRPRNIFPSFHAALCATVFRVVPAPPGLRIALGAWISAICVSCILTKQHYALDVVAGLLVGAVAVAAVDAARRWAARARIIPARPSASATSRITT